MGEPMINSFEKDRFYQTVGRAVAMARTDAGMSQRVLAEASGLALATIQNVESGCGCSLMVCAKIAHGLDVIMDELVPLDALR